MPDEISKYRKNKRTTIYDVANALGVSVSTVSRAISGNGRIGKDTKERILDYIQTHDYHSSRIHIPAPRPKTHNIGILLPEVTELVDTPFFHTCMYGVNEMALANGYDMFVISTNGRDTTHLKRLIDQQKVDGLILMRTYRKDTFAYYLKEREMPFVAIGTIDDDEIIQVNYDNMEACKDLTSLLISKNMKRIAYLGEMDRQTVNDERFEGYIQAHRNAGLEIDWKLVFRGHCSPSMIQKKVDEFLVQKVDCILCQDDTICISALKELWNKNARIPEDIRIAACHNSRSLDSYPIEITSLRFDIVELGRASCRLLLDLMLKKPVPNKTLLTHNIIMKESTR